MNISTETTKEIFHLDSRAGAKAEPDTRLGQLSQRIRNLRMRVAKAHREIAAAIDAERSLLPEPRLRRFLVSESGLSLSEAKTYLRFDLLRGEEADVLTENGASFGLIRSLVSVDQATRKAALSKLAAGTPVHENTVAKIRREFSDRHLSSSAKREIRRRKALDAASKSLAIRRIEAFKRDFSTFAYSLVDFYLGNVPQGANLSLTDWQNQTATYLKSVAAECEKRFSETFDVETLPAPWLHDYHEIPEELVLLARAREALVDLASGRFQAWDEDYNRPLDTSHDYIDRRIVEAVVWLFEEVDMPPKRPAAAPRHQEAPKVAPPTRLTSIEICAGAGGQALGLHSAGFDALGIYERDAAAVRTLEKNYPLGPIHEADITSVDFTRYRDHVDLVAGGVPCQGHSSIGHQKGRHDERDLFLEAVRIVDEVRPRAFFFENVKGFNFSTNAAYRAELYELFSDLGYESKVFSIFGHDYGLAQERPRVAFVGFRDGALERFRKPPTLSTDRVSVGAALIDLVAANGWKEAERWAAETANRVGPTIVGSVDSGNLSFTSNLQAPAWRRLGIDPNGLADAAPPPDHAGPFKLTLRMGARLQGFPDSWGFEGRTGEIKRQIANAFPPVMAKAIGLAIYTALTGVEFDFNKALKRPLLGTPPGRLAKLNIRKRAEALLEQS